MMRIAIVGGGISGLAAACTIEEHRRTTGAAVDYTLFESSPRLGGVIRTERIDGWLLEAGPDSFLTEKTWAADFCRTLGLGDQLIGSNDNHRKTYILIRGRLEAVPDGLMFMVPTKILPTAFSPLFSWKTKLRMAREFLQPPKRSTEGSGEDESIASLVERHYGSEVVDFLADPLLSGIYGGSASSLSVHAVLPRFAKMEATHGSLGRAMLPARRKKSHAASPIARPIFTSLKNGMQQLVDATVARLPNTALMTDTQVQDIQADTGGWSVTAGARASHFDAVILAVPAHAAGNLIRSLSPALSAELAGIPYTSSIIVGLGYDDGVRRSLPPGFGFLVPHSEGRRILAVTFVHNKFSHRAPEDRALLRIAFAGPNADAVWNLPEEQIVDTVRHELEQILGIRRRPSFSRVYRWKSAMAQYRVGHLERLQRIESSMQKLPGLALAGNGYRGIGIPDCIRTGCDAAREILHQLRNRSD